MGPLCVLKCPPIARGLPAAWLSEWLSSFVAY
jgi:hypothetical protein